MINKIVSFSFSSDYVSSNCISPDIGECILPLFLNHMFVPENVTIEQACFHLKNWLKSYVTYYHSKDMSSSINLYDSYNRIDSYFSRIDSGTLYLIPYQSYIHPLLIKLSLMLPSGVPFTPFPSFSLDVLSPLFFAISSYRCLDQHRDSLRRILNSQISHFFDPPIAKFVDLIYFKMESQIQLMIQFWDNTLFKGYSDTQSLHSNHIVYLLLDDLFHIGAGSFSLEDDILLDRSSLGLKICKACFEGKLTLKHLFSDGQDNWMLHLAKQLSLGPESISSDLKFTPKDILDSPHFLSYLNRIKALSSFELTLLSSCFDPNEDDVFFEISWLKFSNVIGEEEISFNELFVTLLLSYIRDTLSCYSEDSFFTFPSIQLTNSINPLILNKVLFHFSSVDSSNIYYTFEEIRDGFTSEDSQSDYYKPFLKPYLRLPHFMAAYCYPDDVSELFHKFLYPHRKKQWVFDTLIFMFVVNPKAAMNLPFTLLLSVYNDKNQSLLYSFTARFPDKILNFLENQFFPLEYLVTKVDSRSEPPLYWLAENRPDILLKILIYIESSLTIVGSFKDYQNKTFFHFLARYIPELFYNIINEIPNSIETLSVFRDLDDCNPFYILAEYNPKFFRRILSDSPKPKWLFIKNKDKKNQTALHHFCIMSAECFAKCVLESILPIEFLVMITNSVDGSCFVHWMAQYSPDALSFLVEESHDMLSLFSELRTNEGLTVIHLMFKYCKGVTYTLFTHHMDKLRPIIDICDQDSISIFHTIARDNGSFFNFLFYKDILSFDEIVSKICSVTLDTPFHWLARYNPVSFLSLTSNRSDLNSQLLLFKNLNGDSPLDVFKQSSSFSH